MKYKTILLATILSFFLGINSINASSATCTYGTGLVSLEITIDSNYKISYANKSTSAGNVVVGNVDVAASDLLNSENEFYCPTNINYKIVSSGGRSATYDYSFSNNLGSTLSLTNSTIDNEQDSSETQKTIINECEYGSYSITLLSDGTAIGNRSGYNVNVGVLPSSFVERCPSEIYVADSGGRGGYFASIYFSQVTGTTAIPLDAKETTEGETEDGNHLDDPINLNLNSDFCVETYSIWRLVGYIVYALKILAPLLIIVLGSIDFAKAVISKDNKASSEAAMSLVRRLIAGIAIFFVPTVISFLLSLINSSSTAMEASEECQVCLLRPFSSDCDGNVADSNQNGN